MKGIIMPRKTIKRFVLPVTGVVSITSGSAIALVATSTNFTNESSYQYSGSFDANAFKISFSKTGNGNNSSTNNFLNQNNPETFQYNNFRRFKYFYSHVNGQVAAEAQGNPTIAYAPGWGDNTRRRRGYFYDSKHKDESTYKSKYKDNLVAIFDTTGQQFGTYSNPNNANGYAYDATKAKSRKIKIVFNEFLPQIYPGGPDSTSTRTPGTNKYAYRDVYVPTATNYLKFGIALTQDLLIKPDTLKLTTIYRDEKFDWYKKDQFTGHVTEFLNSGSWTESDLIPSPSAIANSLLKDELLDRFQGDKYSFTILSDDISLKGNGTPTGNKSDLISSSLTKVSDLPKDPTNPDFNNRSPFLFDTRNHYVYAWTNKFNQRTFGLTPYANRKNPGFGYNAFWNQEQPTQGSQEWNRVVYLTTNNNSTSKQNINKKIFEPFSRSSGNIGNHNDNNSLNGNVIGSTLNLDVLRQYIPEGYARDGLNAISDNVGSLLYLEMYLGGEAPNAGDYRGFGTYNKTKRRPLIVAEFEVIDNFWSKNDDTIESGRRDNYFPFSQFKNKKSAISAFASYGDPNNIATDHHYDYDSTVAVDTLMFDRTSNNNINTTTNIKLSKPNLSQSDFESLFNKYGSLPLTDYKIYRGTKELGTIPSNIIGKIVSQEIGRGTKNISIDYLWNTVVSDWVSNDNRKLSNPTLLFNEDGQELKFVPVLDGDLSSWFDIVPASPNNKYVDLNKTRYTGILNFNANLDYKNDDTTKQALYNKLKYIDEVLKDQAYNENRMPWGFDSGQIIRNTKLTQAQKTVFSNKMYADFTKSNFTGNQPVWATNINKILGTNFRIEQHLDIAADYEPILSQETRVNNLDFMTLDNYNNNKAVDHGKVEATINVVFGKPEAVMPMKNAKNALANWKTTFVPNFTSNNINGIVDNLITTVQPHIHAIGVAPGRMKEEYKHENSLNTLAESAPDFVTNRFNMINDLNPAFFSEKQKVFMKNAILKMASRAEVETYISKIKELEKTYNEALKVYNAYNEVVANPGGYSDIQPVADSDMDNWNAYKTALANDLSAINSAKSKYFNNTPSADPTNVSLDGLNKEIQILTDKTNAVYEAYAFLDYDIIKTIDEIEKPDTSNHLSSEEIDKYVEEANAILTSNEPDYKKLSNYTLRSAALTTISTTALVNNNINGSLPLLAKEAHKVYNADGTISTANPVVDLRASMLNTFKKYLSSNLITDNNINWRWYNDAYNNINDVIKKVADIAQAAEDKLGVATNPINYAQYAHIIAELNGAFESEMPNNAKLDSIKTELDGIIAAMTALNGALGSEKDVFSTNKYSYATQTNKTAFDNAIANVAEAISSSSNVKAMLADSSLPNALRSSINDAIAAREADKANHHNQTTLSNKFLDAQAVNALKDTLVNAYNALDGDKNKLIADVKAIKTTLPFVDENKITAFLETIDPFSVNDLDRYYENAYNQIVKPAFNLNSYQYLSNDDIQYATNKIDSLVNGKLQNLAQLATLKSNLDTANTQNGDVISTINSNADLATPQKTLLANKVKTLNHFAANGAVSNPTTNFIATEVTPVATVTKKLKDYIISTIDPLNIGKTNESDLFKYSQEAIQNELKTAIAAVPSSVTFATTFNDIVPTSIEAKYNAIKAAYDKLGFNNKLVSEINGMNEAIKNFITPDTLTTIANEAKSPLIRTEQEFNTKKAQLLAKVLEAIKTKIDSAPTLNQAQKDQLKAEITNISTTTDNFAGAQTSAIGVINKLGDITTADTKLDTAITKANALKETPLYTTSSTSDAKTNLDNLLAEANNIKTTGKVNSSDTAIADAATITSKAAALENAIAEFTKDTVRAELKAKLDSIGSDVSPQLKTLKAREKRLLDNPSATVEQLTNAKNELEKAITRDPLQKAINAARMEIKANPDNSVYPNVLDPVKNEAQNLLNSADWTMDKQNAMIAKLQNASNKAKLQTLVNEQKEYITAANSTPTSELTAAVAKAEADLTSDNKDNYVSDIEALKTAISRNQAANSARDALIAAVNNAKADDVNLDENPIFRDNILAKAEEVIKTMPVSSDVATYNTPKALVDFAIAHKDDYAKYSKIQPLIDRLDTNDVSTIQNELATIKTAIEPVLKGTTPADTTFNTNIQNLTTAITQGEAKVAEAIDGLETAVANAKTATPKMQRLQTAITNAEDLIASPTSTLSDLDATKNELALAKAQNALNNKINEVKTDTKLANNLLFEKNALTPAETAFNKPDATVEDYNNAEKALSDEQDLKDTYDAISDAEKALEKMDANSPEVQKLAKELREKIQTAKENLQNQVTATTDALNNSIGKPIGERIRELKPFNDALNISTEAANNLLTSGIDKLKELIKSQENVADKTQRLQDAISAGNGVVANESTVSAAEIETAIQNLKNAIAQNELQNAISALKTDNTELVNNTLFNTNVLTPTETIANDDTKPAIDYTNALNALNKQVSKAKAYEDIEEAARVAFKLNTANATPDKQALSEAVAALKENLANPTSTEDYSRKLATLSEKIVDANDFLDDEKVVLQNAITAAEAITPQTTRMQDMLPRLKNVVANPNSTSYDYESGLSFLENIKAQNDLVNKIADVKAKNPELANDPLFKELGLTPAETTAANDTASTEDYNNALNKLNEQIKNKPIYDAIKNAEDNVIPKLNSTDPKVVAAKKVIEDAVSAMKQGLKDANALTTPEEKAKVLDPLKDALDKAIVGAKDLIANDIDMLKALVKSQENIAAKTTRLENALVDAENALNDPTAIDATELKKTLDELMKAIVQNNLKNAITDTKANEPELSNDPLFKENALTPAETVANNDDASIQDFNNAINKINKQVANKYIYNQIKDAQDLASKLDTSTPDVTSAKEAIDNAINALKPALANNADDLATKAQELTNATKQADNAIDAVKAKLTDAVATAKAITPASSDLTDAITAAEAVNTDIDNKKVSKIDDAIDTLNKAIAKARLENKIADIKANNTDSANDPLFKEIGLTPAETVANDPASTTANYNDALAKLTNAENLKDGFDLIKNANAVKDRLNVPGDEVAKEIKTNITEQVTQYTNALKEAVKDGTKDNLTAPSNLLDDKISSANKYISAQVENLKDKVQGQNNIDPKSQRLQDAITAANAIVAKGADNDLSAIKAADEELSKAIAQNNLNNLINKLKTEAPTIANNPEFKTSTLDPAEEVAANNDETVANYNDQAAKIQNALDKKDLLKAIQNVEKITPKSENLTNTLAKANNVYNGTDTTTKPAEALKELEDAVLANQQGETLKAMEAVKDTNSFINSPTAIQNEFNDALNIAKPIIDKINNGETVTDVDKAKAVAELEKLANIKDKIDQFSNQKFTENGKQIPFIDNVTGNELANLSDAKKQEIVKAYNDATIPIDANKVVTDAKILNDQIASDIVKLNTNIDAEVNAIIDAINNNQPLTNIDNKANKDAVQKIIDKGGNPTNDKVIEAQDITNKFNELDTLNKALNNFLDANAKDTATLDVNKANLDVAINAAQAAKFKGEVADSSNQSKFNNAIDKLVDKATSAKKLVDAITNKDKQEFENALNELKDSLPGLETVKDALINNHYFDILNKNPEKGPITEQDKQDIEKAFKVINNDTTIPEIIKTSVANTVAVTNTELMPWWAWALTASGGLWVFGMFILMLKRKRK
ncbi:hypothetical protein H9M94_01305 [Mycoplasma sp. Pen4]|uniref:hypothetical protein n=1 Tax=Mycoplasma sp. Pen4 TaxID=640330 RepID=UPI0016542E1D|nr:hypothetical protein [Mycoplasma sp. Pen4]QNM93895.1 hypothetical protein H9M94_01305 [Mycoplasma sp. Pen4]